jgi:hypothetical protein
MRIVMNSCRPLALAREDIVPVGITCLKGVL